MQTPQLHTVHTVQTQLNLPAMIIHFWIGLVMLIAIWSHNQSLFQVTVSIYTTKEFKQKNMR